MAGPLARELVVKTLISIDRLFELYDRLKRVEALGGEEAQFRSILSEVRDETNRLPHYVALLGNPRGAQVLKVHSEDLVYRINLVMTMQSVNVKRSCAMLMAQFSQVTAELEALKEVLERLRGSRPGR